MLLRELRDNINTIIETFGEEIGETTVIMARDGEGNGYHHVYAFDPGAEYTILWPNDVEVELEPW